MAFYKYMKNAVSKLLAPLCLFSRLNNVLNISSKYKENTFLSFGSTNTVGIILTYLSDMLGS